MPPKGKDISAMSARMASAASTQQRAPMAVPPAQSNTVPPASAAAPGAGGVAMVAGGRPKGKDLSRMGGGPPPPPPVGVPVPVGHPAAPFSGPPGAAPPVQVPAPNNMEQRHEIARRKAFGLDAATNNPNMRPSPPMAYQSYSQSAQPLPQHRPLVPNSSQPPQPVDIKVAKAKQPTKRPSHAESRLSRPIAAAATTPSAKATDDHYGNASLAPAVGEKLQKLCHSIDPSYTLDSEVQERLVEMADSFVEKVTKDAIRLARHRGSSSLDVVDIALALKKGYNISVPGLGPPSAARGLGQSVVAMSGVGNTAATGGQYGQYAGGNIKGGWLFADKVNAPAEGGNSKKRKRSSNTAAATSAAM
jgi:transcription initiation factor TFIID subunit 12